MAANNILPFAQGALATVLSQAAYLAASDRTNGNQPGLASQELVNKALLQLSAVAAGVAQFIADRQGTAVDDSLTAAALATMLSAAVRENGTHLYATGGTGGAYTLTPVVPITAYEAGQLFMVSFSVANLDNPTINISGLGATVNLVREKENSGFVNCLAGDWIAGHTSLVMMLDATHAWVVNLPSRGGSSRVTGLLGAPNAATPLTKYDLSAAAVMLRNAAGMTATLYNTATMTCDLGLAGPAANGRDQAAAFAINSWIYLYLIWNPTTGTLATLASTTAPTAFTSATLPAGYTHWAFATAQRWNASSNLVPARTLGSFVWIAVDNGGVNRILSAGVATVFTALNFSSFVPPNALTVDLSTIFSGVHNAIAGFSMTFRPTGATGFVAGMLAADTSSQVANVSFEATAKVRLPLGTGSQIDYKVAAVPSGGGGAYIDVWGYTIPNGDS